MRALAAAFRSLLLRLRRRPFWPQGGFLGGFVSGPSCWAQSPALSNPREEESRFPEAVCRKGTVDDQLDFCDLLNRQVCGFFGLENSAGVDASLSPGIDKTCSIAHKTASRRGVAPTVNSWQGMTGRQSGNLTAVSEEKTVAAH
jgi:hypothetical protein